jgi:TorA maturation chaperone TorD
LPVEPIDEAPLTRNDLAAIAGARAALCAFLNLHFTMLPDESFVGHLRGGEFTRALATLAADEGDAELARGAALMRRFLADHESDEPAALAQTLGVDRTKLYRGVSPTYGPPPPNEVVWDKRVTDAVAGLKALADLYAAAGVGMAGQARERLDYIAVELDFLRLLAVREMEAWQAARPDDARLALQQQSVFVREHLGLWFPAFREQAMLQTQTDFYRGHLTMLCGFLATEQQRLDMLAEAAAELQ